MESRDGQRDQGKLLREGVGVTERSDSMVSADYELTQCEAEVSTLLRIIAELNVKMGALQAPREPDDSKSQGQVSTFIPELDSSPPPHCSPKEDAGTASMESVTKRGGSGELWLELQGVVSALESSISRGRAMVTPHTLCDEEKQTEHLTAARESWVQVTQVLEEMEREFGISYPSALPPEERQQYQRDILTLHKRNQNLCTTLQSRQEELNMSEDAMSELENEKKILQEKLLGLKRRWLSRGSLSPPCSLSSSSSGALSPCWASPPFPGSPLLARRVMGGFPALPAGGDVSPAGSNPGSAAPGNPSLESETERLQRCLETLKARNERLTAALERRKGESEQISMTLSRHEADSTALHMALRYCEECEEAYSELLSRYEARKQQGRGSEGTGLAELLRERQQTSWETQESSSASCAPGGAVERTEQNRRTADESEGAIRERIERLKQDRAAVCIPEQGPVGEGKLSPDTGTLAGPRGHNSAASQNINEEKAALLYELVTVREEMSELRGTIRLTEKDRRCLEWTLMAQKSQDAAGALIVDSLREELEDRRTEQQGVAEHCAKLNFGGGIPGLQNHTLLRELQAVLQREPVLKRRVATIRDSLDSVLSDSATQRRYSEEEMARLTLAHSKITSTYRSARKKYREQLWRLEQQVSAMSERHVAQIADLKATLEALEWRREETVL